MSLEQPFWDRQAERFDTPPPTPQEDEAVRRALEHLRPDDSVLEVGCAAGATGEALRPRVAAWHGIDVSGEMVRRARLRAGDGLTFEQATIDQVATDGYTVVVAFNVLHFMNLERDLERIADLLPSGGRLLAQTPCIGDVNPFSRWLARGFAKVMRIQGLRMLRFDDLRNAVATRFDVVEADGERPGRTWLVATKR